MAVQIDREFSPITVPPVTVQPVEQSDSTSTPSLSFSDQVKNAIDHVNTLQSHADDLVEQVASGNPENAHQAVIAMQQSSMALDFTMQVRNKVLDAYQEIMRMQI